MLFIDLVGSTQLAEQLDPEPLREIMDAYFAIGSASVAEHGGVVEKFIGDAIMAAFGAAVAHEDDAVRAVRAAAAVLGALRELNVELADRYHVALEARCGVCTGDVIVITAPGADVRLVGDAVNTASRLQSAAPPGGILVDSDTAAMVRYQVGVELLAPMQLKGKAAPVAVYRVVGPQQAEEGSSPTPFIGREEEVQELRLAFRRVVRSRQVCLVTVLGVPGIGKSRLVREFLAGVSATDALVLAGSCSAYGRGITYKPLTEMLGSAPGGWPALAGLPGVDGPAANTLATVMDPGADVDFVGTVDIAWAARSLLDALAVDRPVIMVWEDLHWAEETLLDLVDDITARSTDVPVLMMCVARGELLETRPTWGGGKPSAMALELWAMTTEEATSLVRQLAVREEVYVHDHNVTHDHVAQQCDGNPLFAEQLMAVVGQGADWAIHTPPAIHALLGARLDQLPPGERTLVELAAMIGRGFRDDVLLALSADDGIAELNTVELVAALIRRRILLRGRDGTIRFAQTLLRETAYEFTPKARRQRWHDSAARWYAGYDDTLAVAYHVEAAWKLRRELWPGDRVLPELASPAADTLAAEGMRALSRRDLPSAMQLLERARALVGDARHTRIALHICDAALWLGDVTRCLEALAAAEDALPDDGDNAAVCAIQRGIVSIRFGLASPERVTEQTKEIEAVLRAAPHSELSWCRFRYLQAMLHLADGRAAAADRALRRAFEHAGRLADPYETDRLLCALCEVAQWAPVPVEQGISLCATLATQFASNRALLLPVLVVWTNLLAMKGDLEAARGKLDMLVEHLDEVDLDLVAAAAHEATGHVESFSGRHADAEAAFRCALHLLRGSKHAQDAHGVEVLIARELFEQDRVAEAARGLEHAATTGGGDSGVRIAATALRGRIASAAGRHETAVDVATAAHTLSKGCDDLRLRGQTAFDLAVVLAAAGRAGEAADAAAGALRDFEAKGAVLLADRVRRWSSAAAAATGAPGA